MLLHHDYPSAASLHAVLLVDALRDRGVRVDHHGIDVLGLAVTIPATLDDVADWDRHRADLHDLGWDVSRPRLHPPTLAAHVVERACPDPDRARAWRLACYRAHWLDGRDIGDHDVLMDLAAGVGLDPEPVRADLGDRVRMAAVRRQMTAVRGDGVGGVPVLDADGTKVSPFMDPADLYALAVL